MAFVTNFVSCHEVGIAIGIERLMGQYQYQYLEGVKFQYQYQYRKVADGQYQYQYQYLENGDFNTNTNTGPYTNSSIPIPGIARLWIAQGFRFVQTFGPYTIVYDGLDFPIFHYFCTTKQC